MIFDRLANQHLYPLGPAWQEAFQFISALTPDSADGKHHLRGDDLFAIVMSYQTQAPAASELEAHRRYLDIQVVLAGREGVICHFVPDLQILQPYDASKDVALYQVPAIAPARFILTPGTFLAFHPHDAHMPCLTLEQGPAPVKKAVIKVAVELLGG